MIDMLIVFYIAALCAANYLVFIFGPWWSIINSFVLIGFDFIVRDKLHERLGLNKISLIVIVAAVLSYLINPAGGMIAVASGISFLMASLTDGFIYQRLIKRKWVVKSNASNIAASAVDSILFPIIAFGSFMPWIIAGQFLTKIFGGFVWSFLLRRIK